MNDNVKAFLERHPGVTPEEIDELLEPQRRSRRWILAVAVVLALSLVATTVVALRFNHVVQNDAEIIAAELAQEQVAEVQRVLGARAEAGRQLAVRVFSFMIDLARDNEVLRGTQRGWDDLRRRTSDIRGEVSKLRYTPIDSSKRIVRAVPELVDALVTFVTGFMAQLDRLGPQFATALDRATGALTADDFDPNELLDALEVALDPLMGANQEQRMSWQNLRAEVVAWRAGLEADVAELRGKVDDETLSREFVARFVDAFFGR